MGFVVDRAVGRHRKLLHRAVGRTQQVKTGVDLMAERNWVESRNFQVVEAVLPKGQAGEPHGRAGPTKAGPMTGVRTARAQHVAAFGGDSAKPWRETQERELARHQGKTFQTRAGRKGFQGQKEKVDVSQREKCQGSVFHPRPSYNYREC
jgi:hypothetical protein